MKKIKKKTTRKVAHLILGVGTGDMVAAFTNKVKLKKALARCYELKYGSGVDPKEEMGFSVVEIPLNDPNEKHWDI